MRKSRSFKTLLILAAVLILLPLSGRAVYAAEDTEETEEETNEFDYSGPLDPETLKPAPADEETETVNGRVKISDNLYYDGKTGDFVYPLGNSTKEVRSSAADGMVVSNTVSIRADSASDVVVYLNGEEYTGKLDSIAYVGEYLVYQKNSSDLSRLFSFTIVGKATNGLQQFTVPDGFYMTGAMLDGEDIDYSRFNVRLEAEGAYQITYTCMASERSYTFATTIDRTPPELEFSGRINSQNQVRSELTFTGVESGGTVTVTMDGNPYTVKPDSTGVYTLRNSGRYNIRVYDAADNMTEYNYEVMMYFNTGSIIFVIVAAVILIGIGVYVLFRRKSLKIG